MGVTYYKLLGVSQDATGEEIESAYRRASKAYHPDAGSPMSDPAMFRMVVKARTVLTDSHERQKYDAEILASQFSLRSVKKREFSAPQQPSECVTPQPPSSASNPIQRKPMQRSYSLLVVAGIDYVVSRWLIEFGLRIHVGAVSLFGHQLMGLGFFPVIAFAIVPKESILRLWARFRAAMSKHHKGASTRIRSHRTNVAKGFQSDVPSAILG